MFLDVFYYYHKGLFGRYYIILVNKSKNIQI